jgi:Protein of unknown function (DUF3617)
MSLVKILKEDCMRKMILFLGVICLLAPVVLAGGKAQPFNVKPGLWQTTWNTVATGRPPIPEGLTPEQRARYEAMMSKVASGAPNTGTYKSCVTKDQLNPANQPSNKCTWTVLDSTGSKLDLHGTCTGSQDFKMDMTVHLQALDTENVKGTGQQALTSGGNTMNSKFNVTSKWIGSDCGNTK